MSLIQTDFLRVPLANALKIYTKNIGPKLTKKNKVIGVGAAIFITVFSIIRDLMFKPPKNLRHIPYFGYASLVKSLFKKESIFDRGTKIHVPFIDNTKKAGIYLEPGRGKWELHISDPEEVKKVLHKHETYPKSDFTSGLEHTLFSKFLGSRNLLLSNSDDWKVQKNIMNPAFRRSMPVKIFGEITLDLFKTIDSMSQPVEVFDLMTRCALEAIGKAGFGFDFHALTNMKDNKWTDLYSDVSEGFGDYKFSIFPSFEKQWLWLFPKRRELHQKLDEFLNMLDNLIQKKKESLTHEENQSDLEENEKDLLTLMIESEQKGEGALSDENLKSNLCLFVFAGHETTASALTFEMYYLGKYPEIQQKAREEAFYILGDEPIDVLPAIQDLTKMKYIGQIIKETLRISDPAPRVLSRYTIEDTVISDTFVPKGTTLIPNIYNVHHSDKYWKNPDQFDPSRFDEDEVENIHWIPFGSGVRSCIGMNFSLNEQRVILSMMLRKYKWSLPDDSIHKNGVVTSGVTVIHPVEMKLNFTKLY